MKVGIGLPNAVADVTGERADRVRPARRGAGLQQPRDDRPDRVRQLGAARRARRRRRRHRADRADDDRDARPAAPQRRPDRQAGADRQPALRRPPHPRDRARRPRRRLRGLRRRGQGQGREVRDLPRLPRADVRRRADRPARRRRPEDPDRRHPSRPPSGAPPATARAGSPAARRPTSSPRWPRAPARPGPTPATTASRAWPRSPTSRSATTAEQHAQRLSDRLLRVPRRGNGADDRRQRRDRRRHGQGLPGRLRGRGLRRAGHVPLLGRPRAGRPARRGRSQVKTASAQLSFARDES